jgi:hypothetical protein
MENGWPRRSVAVTRPGTAPPPGRAITPTDIRNVPAIVPGDKGGVAVEQPVNSTLAATAAPAATGSSLILISSIDARHRRSVHSPSLETDE